MNRALKLSLAITLALLALSGCKRNDDEKAAADVAARTSATTPSTPPADTTATSTASSTATTEPAGPTPSTAPAAGALTQAQAVTLVGAVDKHEIAAAEQARGKKVTRDVLDFANLLHSEHTKNLEAGQKLGATESSPELTAMEEKGRNGLAELDRKSGKDYEKAYVDAMVKGHEEALSMIDTRLLPAATDDNVRTFLTNSREHVAMHLEKGKALQSKMRAP